MGTHITKVRRTGSGKYEATVYEVGPKTLRPVLVVHGSKALVSRASMFLPAAPANVGKLAEVPALESGTFKAAVADNGDAPLHLWERGRTPNRRRT